MENSSDNTFLISWHYAMLVGSVIMVIAGVIVYVVHKVRVSSIRDYKAKYDYINLREIKNYRLMFICFGIAGLMAINMYGMGKLHEMGVWFFVRFFISVAGGTLIVYVAFLVLEYYYPTILNRKLKKWRYLPRISKEGTEMRLLSEEEEDVHMEEGMRAEEDVFSIDYDVWMDEKTGEVKIEKYPGHLQALQCNSCGFYTMKVVKEEITRQPSKHAAGELIKHYQCSYCKSVRATAFNISTKEVDDYKKTANHRFKTNSSIDLVRVEIHSDIKGKKYFEFQNLDQAIKFLEEYDAEKTV